MTTETMIPAKLWLWTTYLTPMSRDVAVDRPIHPARHERIDGTYMGIYALDLPEGTVLATTHAGVPERFGTHYVVLGEMLQHVHPHEARDLIEPVGATERMHDRLRAEAGLDSVSRRIRFPDGHALQTGEFRRWGGWWAVVGPVTARQAWLRAATCAEILAAGYTLPVAPVGADLLAAIKAEFVEAKAEAASPSVAA